MSIFFTILFTLLLVSFLFYVFCKLKTPHFRVNKGHIRRVLEMVLSGQATENDWCMTFGMVIRHDPHLENIRQQCVEIEEMYYIGQQRPPYLFSTEGRERLKYVLSQLN